MLGADEAANRVGKNYNVCSRVRQVNGWLKMVFEKRVREYARKSFNEVYHCTLNPDGPGVVRIHLVPPLVDIPIESEDGVGVGSSVAIINGQDVIPVNTAWSILLI